MNGKNGKVDSSLVTVIICVYNAGEFLRPSIESVLHQTYRNLEVIVVDDGSTDGCLSLIEDLSDPRMRILRQENRGKPAALNSALLETNGEFFAIQDADDLSHPERIEKQVECMREHLDVAAVFCGYELILNGRYVAPIFTHKDADRCRKDIEKLQMPGHDPTAMYRVSMVKQFQFDETLPIVEGYDYVLRVGERFPMQVLGECLYSYRIHWNTVTKRNPSVRQKMLLNAMKKVLERRGLPYSDSSLPEVSHPARIRNKDLDNDIVSHFMASMVDLRHAGKWLSALRTAASCLMLHPFDPYYYKPVTYAVAPISLIDWHRARKLK
jgi:glycosyltransferase involved in cell wall biosynthesis